MKINIIIALTLVSITSWAQTAADWPQKLKDLDCNRTAVPFVAKEADTTYNPASPSLYSLLLNTANAGVNMSDSAALESVEYAFLNNGARDVNGFVAGVSIRKDGTSCISVSNDTSTVNAVFWFRWDKNWCVYLRTGCRNPVFVFEPFTEKGVPPECKPDTCILFESYNTYHEKTDTIRDTIEEKLNVRPFVEQVTRVEIGNYGYPNGRYDAPTYVGLWLTKPKKNFQLNAGIGYRGPAQQRFGQLAGNDCHCDKGESVWTARFQGAYNFWLSNSASYIQVGIQYEQLLSGAKLERNYPGLQLSKNWRPYGTALISFKAGHDWYLKDKNLGGAIVRTSVGPSYGARHGVAVEASVVMIFTGKKELPVKSPPDKFERWVNKLPEKTWNGVKGIAEKWKKWRVGKKEERKLKRLEKSSSKKK